MSCAIAVKDILDANSSSTGLEFGINLFVGIMPESPVECVSLLDAGGLPDNSLDYQSRFVQALIRVSVGAYERAVTIGEDIRDELHGYRGQPNSGDRYYITGIFASGGLAFIGPDEKNRLLFSINFNVQRR